MPQSIYFLEPDTHIRNKVKVLLDLSNYATKKELEYAVGVDTLDLAAKSVCCSILGVIRNILSVKIILMGSMKFKFYLLLKYKFCILFLELFQR